MATPNITRSRNGRGSIADPLADGAHIAAAAERKLPLSDDCEASGYYPWYDWLRFALAGIVLLSHQGLIGFWPTAADFAVQVFFAMSGWLIGGILIRLPEDELPRFYFNRVLRIWFPYFLALSLLVTVSLMRDHPNRKWAEFVFYKATFVYNLFGPRQLSAHRLEMPLAGTGNHFWSVNAEEQFYLFAPLALVLWTRRYRRATLTWIAVAVLAWISRTYASIAFGVLAANLANTCGPFYRSVPGRATAACAAVISALALALGADYDLAAPVCAIALVLLLAISGNRHRFGALAGGLSYQLYLNAWIAVFAVHAVANRLGITNPFARQTLTVVSSITFAGLLYWHVDRWVLARRRLLYTERRARIAVAVTCGTVAIGLCGGIFGFGATR